MQKSVLLNSLRKLISRESTVAAFGRGPRRRSGRAVATRLLAQPAIWQTDSLEDRTLLSVTATLVGSTLTVSLNANNAEAWVSFSSGLKVAANADGSVMAFNGTLANTVTTLIINNNAGYTGVKVNFAGSNTISGTNGTAAVALTSLSVTGIPTINLSQQISATTVSGTATSLNLSPISGAATNGHLPTAVSLTAPSGTIDIAAGTYTLTGTLTITKAVRLRGAARDQVIINTSGSRGTENRLIQLNAAGSTIESLTMAGWTAATTAATSGSGNGAKCRTTT